MPKSNERITKKRLALELREARGAISGFLDLSPADLAYNYYKTFPGDYPQNNPQTREELAYSASTEASRKMMLQQLIAYRLYCIDNVFNLD